MDMVIALPSVLYVLRPKEKQDIIKDREEFNIYFSNIILPLKAEYDVRVECDYGINTGDFWRISEFPYDCDSFPLTIAVYDEWGIRIAEKSTTVVMNEKKKCDEFCLMPIGDSMTHTTTHVEQVVSKLKNITTRGIRCFNGLIRTEGRGGWSYDSYFNNTAICWGGVSPFLFPEGVEPEAYYGDWDFEETKKNPDRELTYSYDGLPVQKLCDGMYFHRDGKLFLRENGEDKLASDNIRWDFSFSKYIKKFNPGHIDAVSLLMGGNDLQVVRYEDSDRVISKFVSDTQRMIDNIWEYNPDMKIIINLPIIGAEQYSWGKQMGCVGGSKQYRFNVIKAANALIEHFTGMKNVYISASLLNLDPVFGFDKEPYKANMYADDYVMKHSNWVHPNVTGYKQMGDALAAVIEAIR